MNSSTPALLLRLPGIVGAALMVLMPLAGRAGRDRQRPRKTRGSLLSPAIGVCVAPALHVARRAWANDRC